MNYVLFFQKITGRFLPFELKSPNARPAVETYTAFVMSGVVGVRRIAVMGLLKTDQALHRVR